jgi:hypothetical protein
MACLLALAQTITGSITGLIIDSRGAVVAGAKVTAINLLTGVATSTVTNPSGIYSLRFLQIGQYKISVESSSFSQRSTSVFWFEVDQDARVNVALKVASSNSSVVVIETGPILNTENATTGDTITAASPTKVPLKRASVSGYYQLPFGRGRQFGGGMNPFEDETAGGWKVASS